MKIERPMRLSLSTILLTLTSVSFATSIGPTPLPLARISANVEARLELNPADHEAHYTLARANYLAFANGLDQILGYDHETQISLAAPWMTRGVTGSVYDEVERRALKKMGYETGSDLPDRGSQQFHDAIRDEIRAYEREQPGPWSDNPEAAFVLVTDAITSFKRAIALQPDNGLYHLGLASLYVQYEAYRSRLDAPDEPAELQAISEIDARKHFLAAYLVNVDRDLRVRNQPVDGLQSLVSYEAGRAFVRSTENDPNARVEDKKLLPSIRRTLAKLRTLKSWMITPIIFSLEQRTRLSDLLAADSSVQFDLRGNGIAETWPWVKPTTCFLVWDEFDTGVITSGRQMFGSVTWWLFFRNGYRALDVLDDNRDGRLDGDELAGIAAWFDRNIDGVSDPGEVVSLESLRIRAIMTEPTGEDGGAPMHRAGLLLDDGSTIPTFDWIASPLD